MPIESPKTSAQGIALSLKTKALIVIIALIAYFAGISMYALHQKNLLLGEMVLLGALGPMLIGTAVGIFFWRLTVAFNNLADTLDQKQQELLLERQKYFHQEKMASIGVLSAGIAHEIGNPIAVISGVAQEMMEHCATEGITHSLEKSHYAQAELIFEQAARLSAMTREMAEFASPLAVEPQLLDLNAQLRSTASLIRYDKRLSKISLQFNLDSQLPAIYGVADQLTQMIMNLVINGMDALEGIQDRPPTITITTSVEAERACLMITDNGMGMNQKILNRAFEAFFTTKSAGKGTGLGLSLCYSIAQAHGGTIEIESTPGEGTKVTVFFPLNNPHQN
ncbi:MAG: ATP-binding protein [Rhodoferax sp.]|uniref:sensor histidine kinase n=1 Tax=Rhodoferax sp. TaxID=50421 RepID=UPI0030176FC3